MLKRLKSLLRARAPEVEYRRQTDVEPGVVPAGPPTAPMPPVAPVNEPGADTKTNDDDRP